MAYQLSEDNIKHATLSFLKTYYKNNSSRGFGDTVATLDMQTGDGIIADGYLKYSVNDDPIAGLSSKDAEKAILDGKVKAPTKKSSFLATFEATSQATAEEVQYDVQNTLLTFDAMAIASIVAAGSYGYNYMNDQFTLNQLGTFKFFGGFLLVMIASTIAYILIFRKLLPRYRYIYALAQFKKYHANEQWVSYGEDVFANPDNKYLLELKKQCIRQGFGLIAVDKGLQPSLVVTPRREESKKNKYKIREFTSQSNKAKKESKWLKKFKGIKGLPKFKGLPKIQSLSWFKKFKLPSFKAPIEIDKEDYNRFSKSYWKQIGVIFAMLFVMGEIYLEELKNPNLVYADESRYESIVTNETKNNRPEPFDVLVENDETAENQKIKKNKPAPTKKVKSTTLAATAPQTKVKTNPINAFIISNGLGEYMSYGCDRLSGIKGNNFLVQLDIATSSTEAVRKVKTFNENGFNCNAIWLGCFQNKNKEYVVYLDDIFDSKDVAVKRATDYQKLQLAKGITKPDPPIRMITGRGK